MHLWLPPFTSGTQYCPYFPLLLWQFQYFLCRLIFLYPAIKSWHSSSWALFSHRLLFPWAISTMPVASLITLREVAPFLIPDFSEFENLEPTAYVIYFGYLQSQLKFNIVQNRAWVFPSHMAPFQGFLCRFHHSSSYINWTFIFPSLSLPLSNLLPSPINFIFCFLNFPTFHSLQLSRLS